MPARNGRAGGPLRRLGLDRPVHQVDDRAHRPLWNDYCKRSGRAPACGVTSFYPTIAGHDRPVAVTSAWPATSARASPKARSATSTTRTRSAPQFPVAKMLNAAGYYTEPTPENVAVVAAEGARSTPTSPTRRCTSPRTSSGVYTDTDPRNYQLSSYSYLILPTKVAGQFNEDKGKTLGGVRVLRDVPGAAAVRVARLLADADQPGGGELRPDPQDPRCRSCRTSTSRRARTRRSRPTARTCWPRRRRSRRRATSRAARQQCPNGTGGSGERADRGVEWRPAATGGDPTTTVAGAGHGRRRTLVAADSGGGDQRWRRYNGGGDAGRRRRPPVTTVAAW